MALKQPAYFAVTLKFGSATMDNPERIAARIKRDLKGLKPLDMQINAVAASPPKNAGTPTPMKPKSATAAKSKTTRSGTAAARKAAATA